MLVVAASTIASVVACATPSPPPPQTITVTMADVAFAPAEVNAHLNDTLEWVNKDIVDHTGTARNGTWDVVVEPGRSGKVVLTSAGTIDYYCKLHPNMVGKITVR